MRTGYMTSVGALASALLACSSSTTAGSGVSPDVDAGATGNVVDAPADTARGTDAAAPNDAPSTSDVSSASDVPPASETGPDVGAYPSGPYGTTVGAVIANMTWTGYVDDAADALATTKTYGTYSLDDARKSGRRYAMINLAESYCPGCQKSAGEFAADGAAVVKAGGIVIEVLETTGFTSQASKANLDAWVTKYKLPITTLKDPDGAGTPTLTTLGPREHAYLVDLTTMKILQVITGDNFGIGATSGGLGMAEMHKLLGK
jgi:hypothetical protein